MSWKYFDFENEGFFLSPVSQEGVLNDKKIDRIVYSIDSIPRNDNLKDIKEFYRRIKISDS